ncbi:MAG: heavy metal translocating P-type ATPase [Gemmataceae bacterium]
MNRPVLPSPRLWLRSSVPGRQRWEAPALMNAPRRAAAVQRFLCQQPGMGEVHVNPVTGRLLLYCDRSLDPVAIEPLLHAALAQPPLSADDYHAWQHEHDHEHGCKIDHYHGDACGHDHDHEHDVETAQRNMILGGVVLLGLLVKRLIFGPGRFAGNPVLFAISSAAAIISGYPFIRGAVRSASGQSGITTDTLVGSATLASIVLRESVTALVVIWLLNVGEYLQALTLRRTNRAIRALLEISDEEVWLVVGDVEARRLVTEIQPGDVVAIYAGDRIPVDGQVIKGQGTVNEAPITGESMPVSHTPGDTVFAGTILLSGDLRIRVEKVGMDTAVGRLIRRVEEAQELRAPIQTIGERFSERFVPVSFCLAIGVFVVTGDIRRSLTMLLIACPCAAGLATPTAVSAAIGNGARRGILIKGGTHLENAAKVDTVVFDKTGTLTIGLPGVERVIALDERYTPDQVLAIAATGELHSQHPLALAVVRHAENREIVIPPHEECEVIIGRGMHAFGDNSQVLVGNQRLLEQFDVAISDEGYDLFTRHAEAGETMMYVAHQGRLIGLIGVRDKIRPEAAVALSELRRAGIRDLLMYTGDGDESARSVAHHVGLTNWQARMLPEEKYERIRELREQGHHMAMVGDGINDAPALALADVGIAMGTAGSDVAIEAADIALAADDLRRVATTIRLSRRALEIIRQNYAMALGVNSVGVLVGALGAINPFIAAILHNLSTLLVVVNSARLIAYDPDQNDQADARNKVR